MRVCASADQQAVEERETMDTPRDSLPGEPTSAKSREEQTRREGEERDERDKACGLSMVWVWVGVFR